MKIKTFKVKNYRSFTEEQTFELADRIVIIGKNNEGKSNLLKGLNLALITIFSTAGELWGGLNYQEHMSIKYDSNRDFPQNMNYEIENREKCSEFYVEFICNEKEQAYFAKKYGNEIGAIFGLKIRLTDSFSHISPIIQKEYLETIKNISNKSFCEFVYDNLQFIYIPAIRPETKTIEILNNLVNEKIKTLEFDKDYANAQKIINDKQESLLNKIAQDTISPLKRFLPEITDVKISIVPEKYSFNRKSVDYKINDGVLTSIDNKGDGIKSLVALALISNKIKKEKSAILAIEEPESHLHPDAIHQVDKVLTDISSKNQVIITTHNPIFVNRYNINQNNIVEKNKVLKAKSLHEIRSILGVKISDNLFCADNIILVEGETDVKVIKSILLLINPNIKELFENKTLDVISLNGVNHLQSRVGLYKGFMCSCYSLIDNDKESKNAAKATLDKGLMSQKEVFYIGNNGKRESELEDIYKSDFCKDYIYENYGISIDSNDLKMDKKWSDNLKEKFLSCGKDWNETIETEIKIGLSNLFCNSINIQNINKSSTIIDTLNSIISLINNV